MPAKEIRITAEEDIVTCLDGECFHYREVVMRLADQKQALPILSFPSVSLLGISVKELIASSESQANGMRLVAENIPS